MLQVLSTLEYLFEDERSTSVVVEVVLILKKKSRDTQYVQQLRTHSTLDRDLPAEQWGHLLIID